MIGFNKIVETCFARQCPAEVQFTLNCNEAFSLMTKLYRI